jgi:hypothetical protein
MGLVLRYAKPHTSRGPTEAPPLCSELPFLIWARYDLCLSVPNHHLILPLPCQVQYRPIFVVRRYRRV